MQQATIKIKGMACMGCVKSIKAVLKTINGVQSVEVSLEDGTAEVEFEKVGIEVLRNGVEEAGFEVVL